LLCGPIKPLKMIIGEAEEEDFPLAEEAVQNPLQDG
jgi:hypothetical protein